MTRPTVAIIAVLGSMFIPTSAHAWSISGFKARDRGVRIHYYISVCGARGRYVTFTSYLHTDMGVGPTYSGTWHERQRFGCTRWNLSETDRYATGEWDARLRVVVGGSAKWTRRRYLYID
jgi:hypothetical protein